VIHELEKVGIIHLYTLGFRGDDLINFKLALNNPSKIAELQELEHWKNKFDIAGAATEGYFSRRWVSEHIFNLSHEDFARCQREMYYDRKQDAALQAVAEAQAAVGGGMGAGLGDDLGGDLAGGEGGLDLGPEGAGGDLGDAPPTGEEPAGEESSLLAAPPGTRNAPRLTPGSRGKVYYPQRTDSRPAGARSRHFSHIGTPEMNTMRTNNLGYPELRSLGRGITEGVYGDDDPIYSLREQKEEIKMLEINKSITNLLEDLEQKKEEPTEQKDES